MNLLIKNIKLYENDFIQILAKTPNEREIKEMEDSGWALNKRDEASRLVIFNNNLHPNRHLMDIK